MEICGLLFGTERTIEAVKPVENVAMDPSRRFEIDPAALIAAHRAQRHGGPTLIGHFHSHPTGLAEPSPRDEAEAAGDGALWLILGAGQAGLWRSETPGRLTRLSLAVTVTS